MATREILVLPFGYKESPAWINNTLNSQYAKGYSLLSTAAQADGKNIVFTLDRDIKVTA